MRESFVGVNRCGIDSGGKNGEAKARKEARIKLEDEIKASLNEFWNTEIEPCKIELRDKFHKSEKRLPICCEGEGPDKCGCPKGKECCHTAPPYASTYPPTRRTAASAETFAARMRCARLGSVCVLLVVCVREPRVVRLEPGLLRRPPSAAQRDKQSAVVLASTRVSRPRS
jgi:hypothetical protein